MIHSRNNEKLQRLSYKLLASEDVPCHPLRRVNKVRQLNQSSEPTCSRKYCSITMSNKLCHWSETPDTHISKQRVERRGDGRSTHIVGLSNQRPCMRSGRHNVHAQ